jgi:DNA-binding transcriptional LysR family regulator
MLHEINLSRIDLNLFVLFEAVREEGHVGRAAERLNLSASAVSHGLSRLRRLLNDPLFLRTPKGVVPTVRAEELAVPIAEILAQARRVVATAEPFDPSTSSRRFMIGAPDGALAAILSPLLGRLRKSAPAIDIGIRQVLPMPGALESDRAWNTGLADLESRALDIAILPVDRVPPRFSLLPLFDEEFVIGMRKGHPFARQPTLDRYCDARHLVVSMTGEPFGFVDKSLQEVGRARRIATSVPNFMLALATVADSDLLAALPQSLLSRNAKRFGLQSVAAPLQLPSFQISAVATKAALMDAGVAWLFGLLGELHATAGNG